MYSREAQGLRRALIKQLANCTQRVLTTPARRLDAPRSAEVTIQWQSGFYTRERWEMRFGPALVRSFMPVINFVFEFSYLFDSSRAKALMSVSNFDVGHETSSSAGAGSRGLR